MKYYVRYFDDETMVGNMKEAMDFLSSLPGVEMNEQCVEQLTTYFTTDQKGSKKIFMPNRRSFLIIKTTVNTLEEFKANNQRNVEATEEKTVAPKSLDAEQKGWYECKLAFQRMVTNPDTKKSFYYNDTLEAKVMADSARAAYERMVQYLKENPDVDSRSQMPAASSKNFAWKFAESI